MNLSDRAMNAAPSPTLAVTARAKALKAEGVDIIGFGAGEPDFDTPEHICEAAIEAIRSGYTRYTPSSGDPEIRAAIAAKLARENGLIYRPDQVIVSCGAKHALYNIFQALLNPGDEVIIPAPYWVSYPEQVKLAGGAPVVVETTQSAGFIPAPIDVRASITPRTRAIVYNFPSNPTGAVAGRETAEAIGALCIEHDLCLISDEIYEHLLYDGKTHVSPAALSPELFAKTVTVNGCSKAYAMTGWRIGYAAAQDAALVGAMGRIQDQSTSNPTSIAQRAAAAALNGPQEMVREMRDEFQRRRNMIVDRLNAMPGVSCSLPGGAFYAFADVSGVLGRRASGREVCTSDELAEYLLESAGVAVVPGSGFGAPEFIRLSYATSSELIERGMDRMAGALRRLD